MKFSELSPDEQQNKVAFYNTILTLHQHNAITLTQTLWRFLVLGQAAGLAAILTLISSKVKEPNVYFDPALLFTIGLVASVINLMFLYNQANQRAAHAGRQVEMVLSDQIDPNELTGWDHYKWIKVLMYFLFLTALSCFVLGVWTIFSIFT